MQFIYQFFDIFKFHRICNCSIDMFIRFNNYSSYIFIIMPIKKISIFIKDMIFIYLKYIIIM